MPSPPRILGFVVQSVPARRALRRRLLDQLPLAVVVEDDGPPPGNPWRGYQRCLRVFLEKEWTHAVVIQDDALVCENFEATVDKVANVFPEQPVCLFYPGAKMHSRRYRDKARQQQSSFFPLNRLDFVPVVAVLWPRAQAESLLTWSQDRDIPGLRKPYRSDDAVCGSWMRHTRTQVYATLPSLVEHPDDTDPVKDGPQKAGHGRDRSRVAASFVEGDPLAIDWTTPS